jgi:hypothetical protein
MIPNPLPKLTAPAATNAARRLWRYAVGETFTGKVKLTTGNRNTWCRNGVLYVNPTPGWEKLVNDLAWLFARRANPTEVISRAFVAKVEAKLWREIDKRGWLVQVERELPPDVAVIMEHIKRENLRRKQLEAGVKRWTTKLARAQTMLTKYERKLKRYHAEAATKRGAP